MATSKPTTKPLSIKKLRAQCAAKAHAIKLARAELARTSTWACKGLASDKPKEKVSAPGPGGIMIVARGNKGNRPESRPLPGFGMVLGGKRT